jgi:UDP-glucuronate decarboxylase
LPADDPKQRKPDITKAAKTLDWRPMIPLRAGLVKTIDYFDSFLRSNRGVHTIGAVRAA